MLHVEPFGQSMVQLSVHSNEQVPPPHAQSVGHLSAEGGGGPEVDPVPLEDVVDPDDVDEPEAPEVVPPPSVVVVPPPSAAPGGTMSQSCEHAIAPTTKPRAPTTERTSEAYGIEASAKRR